MKTKPKWPEEKTAEYVAAIRGMIDTLAAFKNHWHREANKYQNPTGDDADACRDAEQDLSDAMDRFMEEPDQ